MLKTGKSRRDGPKGREFAPLYPRRNLGTKKKRTPRYMPMDGNAAASHVGYGLSDAALIFPITPSSPMGVQADEMASKEKKNAFGRIVTVQQLQSEAGVAGAIHGALAAGSLATTFTASQGLLLMVPNMYKIAGELMPAVFHVTARAVAGQALSIFGDNTDVMATRQTGFALLSSASVQEAMDLGLVAHLASIKSSLPFVHFFDGFRTSHEIQKIDVIDFSEMKELVDEDAIQKFRMRQLHPQFPHTRGSAQGPDIYFQFVEAANKYHDAVPKHVTSCMEQVKELTGRQYKLFDYVGHPNPDTVLVMLAAGIPPAEEMVDYLVKEKGQKIGLVKVRLYRPFDGAALAKAIPKSAKNVVVLERTKEPGSLGEPLYLDVVGSLYENKRNNLTVVGGRYGLGGKDMTPMMVKAAIDNVKSKKPMNHFTVGIIDDVTGKSLKIPGFGDASAKGRKEVVDTVPKGTKQCVFWGLGSDGTVGANKSAIKIIAENTDLNTQGYFSYDAHKTGGVTVSHLRFGPHQIKSQYLIQDRSADYVACHNPVFTQKFDVTGGLKDGGTFVLNSPWETKEEIEANLPASIKKRLAEANAKFYTLNASKLAESLGMKGRINMIMQTAFFKLAMEDLIPIEKSIEYLKAAIKKSYGSKGDKVVKLNESAVDHALATLKRYEYPAKEWRKLKVEEDPAVKESEKLLPPFVRDVMMPALKMKGDYIPVSKMPVGGILPMGTTKYEKRGIAENIPVWDSNKCIQCNKCSLVCPHAAIRPFLLDENEKRDFLSLDKDNKVLKAMGVKKPYSYRIQVSNMDCTGCNLCAEVCPMNCLTMVPSSSDEAKKETKNWDNLISKVEQKPESALPDRASLKGSQFRQPLLEFSGSCGGCGETPHAKLITQLFGDRMVIANATGCSSIWGAYAPAQSYTTNSKGQGPAWANSLFEDNAEFGVGMAIAHKYQRDALRADVQKFVDSGISNLAGVDSKKLKDFTKIAKEWLNAFGNAEKSSNLAEKVRAILDQMTKNGKVVPVQLKDIVESKHHFTKISHWIMGGDGWAYDIGYGGLDHVLHMPYDVNVLVYDTEAYSNTGGQRSKATPRGGIAQFAISGKKEKKKDLGMIAMQIGGVYVASICMQADPNQAIKALKEAEKFKGPSLILAYAPCIQHGIEGGLSAGLGQSKKAIDSGYWLLYRYNPDTDKLVVDSKKPKKPLVDFLRMENRFQQLERTFPEEAKVLHAELQNDVNVRYEKYVEMSNPKPTRTGAPAAKKGFSTVSRRAASGMGRENDLQTHPVLDVPEDVKQVKFKWNGKVLSGKEGEVLSTALIANGINIFGEHPRDSSPQGLYCANGMCSQCLVVANGVPVKSCMTPLIDGMNVYPAKIPDLPDVAEEPLEGAEPRSETPKGEKGGDMTASPLECDVLIVGGGPSGMSAASELGKKGASVLLVDDKNILGGKLVVQTHKFFGSKDESAGVRGFEIGEMMGSELDDLETVEVRLNTAALGVFSDGKVGLYDTKNNSYASVVPKKILVATGAREKFLSFPGNTIPGVYGAGAFQTLLNRDLVRPGKKVIIVGGGNVGLITGYHAIQAGVEVSALVEALPRCGGYKVHADKLQRLGVPIYTRHSVKEAIASPDGKKLEKVVIVELDDNFQEKPGTELVFEADTLLLAVGLDPANEFIDKARDFGYDVFSAGDADEIAEASSAMFGGRIVGKVIANELGLSDEKIKEEWNDWAETLKAKPGKVRGKDIIARVNALKVDDGVVTRPVFHCHEEIPCNYCVTCPAGAIAKEHDSISGLPYLCEDAECLSCLECVAGCPGLAITLVSQSDENPDSCYVYIPYELDPSLAQEGQELPLVDCDGKELATREVLEVIDKGNKTLVLKFEVPRNIGNLVAGVRMQEAAPPRRLGSEDKDGREKYVCRCERVTEADIRKAIAEGHTDLNQIKIITRAGMGACGGKTCMEMAKKIMKQMGVDEKAMEKQKVRPLFMETPLSAFLN